MSRNQEKRDEQLQDALDGILSGSDLASWERRLAQDPALQRELAEYEQLRACLGQFGLEDPPATLGARIEQAIASEGGMPGSEDRDPSLPPLSIEAPTNASPPETDADSALPSSGLGVWRMAAGFIVLCFALQVLYTEWSGADGAPNASRSADRLTAESSDLPAGDENGIGVLRSEMDESADFDALRKFDRGGGVAGPTSSAQPGARAGGSTPSEDKKLGRKAPVPAEALREELEHEESALGQGRGGRGTRSRPERSLRIKGGLESELEPEEEGPTGEEEDRFLRDEPALYSLAMAPVTRTQTPLPDATWHAHAEALRSRSHDQVWAASLALAESGLPASDETGAVLQRITLASPNLNAQAVDTQGFVEFSIGCDMLVAEASEARSNESSRKNKKAGEGPPVDPLDGFWQRNPGTRPFFALGNMILPNTTQWQEPLFQLVGKDSVERLESWLEQNGITYVVLSLPLTRPAADNRSIDPAYRIFSISVPPTGSARLIGGIEDLRGLHLAPIESGWPEPIATGASNSMMRSGRLIVLALEP